MKWRLPFFVLFSLLLCAQQAFSGSLIWVERQSAQDRELLLSNGVPLIEEFSSGFLAEGNASLVQSGLDKLGFRSRLLDMDAGASSYAVLAFRSGSIDPDAASSCGDLLWAEQNWMLLRIHEPMPAQCRESSAWFLHLLSRKPLRPAALPPTGYRGAPAFTAKPLVQQMVNSLTDSKIQSHWYAVVNSATTRLSTSAGCQTAAQAVYDKLLAFHLAPVFQSHTPGHAPNVIGVTTGAVNPDAVYIVIGHLDDMPSSGPAPGADDNASGSAIVPMLAEVMSCYAFANTVKFIAVTGEEFGLYGSTYYAEDAHNRGENIQAVLNADMIAWQGDGIPAPEDLDLDYNSASQWLGELFTQCAQDYGTGCVVDAFSCPDLNASDHYPFWVNGWSAVCGITDNEGYCGHGGSYPYYHTSNDTIANCGNQSFYYGAARAYLATLAHLADPFKIKFDRNVGACGDSFQLMIGDRDLNTNPSVQESVALQVWSMTEPYPGESIVLTEQGNDSMIFSGTVQTTPDAVAGDGLISVSGNDTITAQYVDAADCDGSTHTYTDSAAVDCIAPSISNVQSVGVLGSTATITWNTDEAADSRVVYDTVVPPAAHAVSATDAVQSHSMVLPGLTPCTTYYYYVQSTDVIGNTTTDTNSGSYYSFETGMDAITTYHPTDVPQVIRDNTTVVSMINVPDDKQIMDANVKINISHFNDADLDIFLVSPGGTRVELSTDNGGAGNNYTNTVFDDEAATPITAGAAPFAGSFRPEGLLAILDGSSALGTWKLEVTDDRTSDGGYLYSWDLILTYKGAITFSPDAFPNGTPGVEYDQTITAGGGLAPYSFAVSTGSLPAGLSMDSSGHITGIPAGVGTSNFDVTVTDSNGCIAAHSYSITIGCLFCDEFDDGLPTGWTYLKPAWKEEGGQLVATPVRKAIAISDFAGCTNCDVDSTMETAGGPGNKLWMFGWYADRKNTIELLMKEESNKWILRQRAGGRIVAKASLDSAIEPNTPYVVRITFDGSQFHLMLDGVQVLDLAPATPVAAGTVGFAARATQGSFDYVRVN